MRRYYLCEAEVPSRIYTEHEKKISMWPGCRFGLIGEFSTRAKAGAALSDMWNGVYYVLKNNDGETLYIEG